jgi:hypothetical protein
MSEAQEIVNDTLKSFGSGRRTNEDP